MCTRHRKQQKIKNIISLLMNIKALAVTVKKCVRGNEFKSLSYIGTRIILKVEQELNNISVGWDGKPRRYKIPLR